MELRRGGSAAGQAGPFKPAEPMTAPAPEQQRGGMGVDKRRGPRGRLGVSRGPESPYDQKEDSRRKLTVACGVLAGVAALSLGLGGWQLSEASALKAKFESNVRTVVVAATDVQSGHVLEAGDLTVAEIPADYVPADAVAAEGDGSAAVAKLVGRAAVTNLSKGIAVSGSQVQGSDAPASIATAMSDGNVAYMIDASGAQAAAPMLHVGDKVSILAGGEGVDGKVILPDVKVIALDGNLSGASDSYSTVTLDVSPEEAAMLFNTLQVGGETFHFTVSEAAKTNAEEQAAAAKKSAEGATAAAQQAQGSGEATR